MLAKTTALLIKGLIRGYQLLLSPMLSGACRYYPTCSHYALESVDRFGSWRGGWLALRRILRCHPWGGSGLDLVPRAYPNNMPRSRFHFTGIYSKDRKSR